MGIVRNYKISPRYIKVCQVRALLEVRVVFEGGSYMRKYGIQKINHTTERIHLENMYLRIT